MSRWESLGHEERRFPLHLPPQTLKLSPGGHGWEERYSGDLYSLLLSSFTNCDCNLTGTSKYLRAPRKSFAPFGTSHLASPFLRDIEISEMVQVTEDITVAAVEEAITTVLRIGALVAHRTMVDTISFLRRCDTMRT